jgi:hypothetical protein
VAFLSPAQSPLKKNLPEVPPPAVPLDCSDVVASDEIVNPFEVLPGIPGYDDGNLQKHNVTRDEVDQVLDSRNFSIKIHDLAPPPSRSGNNRAMFVGLTFEGRILEYLCKALELHPPHILESAKL